MKNKTKSSCPAGRGGVIEFCNSQREASRCKNKKIEEPKPKPPKNHRKVPKDAQRFRLPIVIERHKK